MSISGSLVPARLPAPRADLDLNLVHAHFTHTTTALDGRVTDLAARRRELGDMLEGFLESWSGEAADVFAAEWSSWRDSADVVIDDLRHSVDALRRTQEDLARVDDAADEDASRLRGRLG